MPGFWAAEVGVGMESLLPAARRVRATGNNRLLPATQATKGLMTVCHHRRRCLNALGVRCERRHWVKIGGRVAAP